MIRARVATALLLSSSVLLGATTSTTRRDDEAVRAPIEEYLKGHATGDASHMRNAFLPTAHIEGIRGGKFTSWTLDEYCAGFKGAPAADESTRRRTIDDVHVSGTAATARATLVHGATTFTDYFVLLKVDGEWKIANKVYSAAPRAK